MSSHLRSNTAVVFSERSRQAYACDAQRLGETYRFTGAFGRPHEWLKGQYAYLAPNALTSVLHRWEIKHDVLAEDEFDDSLDAYNALFLANAGHLGDRQIDCLRTWLEVAGRFVVVTGRTNLPVDLIGLASAEPYEPDGYTGWRWNDRSPFGSRDAWPERALSSYRGYTATRAVAAAGAVVLADLVEFTGDLTAAETATVSAIGDGIVTTDKTLFIANQPFEYLGGVLQAHLNVEAVRGWGNPTHWGDTLAYQMREVLRTTPARRIWDTTLRPFGTYDGVLQLRHDVDHTADVAIDFAMLEAETNSAAPASYYVMDPDFCKTRCTPMGGKIWVEELARYNFIEVGQHNDSVEGDPPHCLVGTGLADHIEASDLTMGTLSRTAGRHMGFLVYPETIDAMAHLYDRNPSMLGLCTFSLYDVIEYGVRHPDVVLHGKQITYSTYDHARPEIPAAISGYWFPYRVVLSTVAEHRTLRGWDVTHDTDCDFDRLETLFNGRNSNSPAISSRLENGVFTVQYETQLARDPRENGGQGHLPWLRYAIAYAERRNFWMATKRRLYERMNDYQDIVFRLDADNRLLLHNPTERTIEGLTIRTPRATPALATGDHQLIHATGDATLLPAIVPGETVALVPGPYPATTPRIRQPNSRFIEIREAWFAPASREVSVRGEVIRRGYVVIGQLPPSVQVIVQTMDSRGPIRTRLTIDQNGVLAVPILGQEDNLIPFTVGFHLP